MDDIETGNQCHVCGGNQECLNVWGSSARGRVALCDTCAQIWSILVDYDHLAVAHSTPAHVIAFVNAVRAIITIA